MQWFLPGNMSSRGMTSMTINKAIGLQQDIQDVTINVRMRRIGAAFVDLLIISCLQIWVSSVFGVLNPASGYQTDGDGVPSFFSGIASIQPVWLYIMALLYFLAQEALFSTTVGKFFFGLYVVNMRGQRLTFKAALLRNILRLIDTFPIFYMVGFVSGILSPTFQRVGDRIAHTTVVPMVLVPHAVYSRATFARRYLVLISVVLLGATFCLLYTYYQRPPLVVAGWMNVNNVVVDDLNHATSTTSLTHTVIPSCGLVQQVAGDYVLGRHIQITQMGPVHWIDNNTISLPIQYADQVPCPATITLHWHGFLDGGWRVSGIHIHS